MQIHVYDTYVKAQDGHTMHFDVFTAVKDDQKAVEYAKQWLDYNRRRRCGCDQPGM
jgi:hypothetical protein